MISAARQMPSDDRVEAKPSSGSAVLDYIGPLAVELNLGRAQADELRRTVSIEGWSALNSRLAKIGIKQADIARAIAKQSQLPLYPRSFPVGDVLYGSQHDKDAVVSKVSHKWLIARNRVLYVINPLDEGSYVTAQQEFGDNIRSLGVIDSVTISKLWSDSPPELRAADAASELPSKSGAKGEEGKEWDAWLYSVIEDAARQDASDIFFMPQLNEVRVRFKIDGEAILQKSLKFGPGPAADQFRALSNRLLSLSGGDGSYYMETYDGSMVHEMSDRTIKLRVAGLPVTLPNQTMPWHKYTLRLLGNRIDALTLDDLGLPRSEDNDQVTKLRLIGEQKHGLFLVTGPTGSGKTTTLSALLQSIVTDHPNKEVITVEDPVELFIDGVNHAEISGKMDWAKALKNILRQAPDVILLGEIRYPDVAQASVDAAQTGHLVLSTLHTNSATESIGRLREIGLAPYNVADVVRGITAQRLVKKVCKHCCEPARWGELTSGKHPRYSKEPKLGLTNLLYKAVRTNYADLANLPQDDEVVMIPSLTGCDRCDSRGYKGRLVVSEFLSVDPIIQGLILEGKPAAYMHAVARSTQGFMEMWEYAMKLVREGALTFDHALMGLNARPNQIEKL